MIVFKGIQKTTMIDFPGEIACTVFIPNCNFRCPYCYNKRLVFGEKTGASISEQEFLEFLDERKGFLDGVCITGGEPTLHKDLPALCKKIKEKDYLVKVDTNGTNPDMIKQLIKEKLVDYLAMDIKAPIEKYDLVAGIGVDKDAVKESVELIKNSKVKYEFRTTILPKFLSRKDVLAIGKWLKGSKLYVLQQFRTTEELLDPALVNAKKYSEQDLKSFVKLLEPFFERVELRNV
ncbi:MAG: anaerobic ribonucleoside-triphosphate reductase activating protein [Candidatus Diapherotrites archaeon]|uniref:Anaerobic ribonucleoside-triphosphate reductase activating protein n=1 Tax=Candidatus Iainarchaeum sp. TaxID=3101447 RepID=A0A2D6M1K7_9ARCH|nr:anaerobic ribonucleoside-triphosphate reductase activating protein [Candidatus Diapherotrites archaeon]|tara:strand:+ start:4712 stop:5413 length:702 start_codon:yes stop_codon:yes gene_type:complete